MCVWGCTFEGVQRDRFVVLLEKKGSGKGGRTAGGLGYLPTQWPTLWGLSLMILFLRSNLSIKWGPVGE